MRLAQIRIHPVKSCRGFDVDRARVQRRGLADDRRWMLVDDAMRFVTQRTLPALALVRASIDGDAIVLAREGVSSLRLPRRLDDGRRVGVEVWGHRGDAIAFDEGRAWFERAVGAAVLPVHMPDSIVRPVRADYARPGDEVSFADGFPLLLTNRASLDDLNARIRARGGDPVAMERFRPSVVVEGAPSFAEDGIRELRIGGVHFRAPKPCERCVIPTIDPDTGVAGKEPTATLATFRRRDGAILFGMNLTPDLPDGEREIAVGDEVEVIA